MRSEPLDGGENLAPYDTEEDAPVSDVRSKQIAVGDRLALSVEEAGNLLGIST
jgi:hypothetical protein